MAHGTTVAKVASDQGTETAIAWADHIIETLEHNLRYERQTVYALADLILKGDRASLFMATEMAKLCKQIQAARQRDKDEWEPKG